MSKIYLHLDAPYIDGITADQVKKLKRDKKPFKHLFKDKELAIYLYLYLRNGVLKKFRTLVFIKPIYWDFEKHEVKTNHSNCTEYNRTITRFKAEITERESKLILDNPDFKTEDITDMVKTVLYGNNRATQIEFEKAIDEFLEDKKKSWSHNTSRRYKSFKNTMIEFCIISNILQLLVKDIDEKFCIKLRNYFIGKGLQNSTIDKNLESVRVFVEWCRKYRYTSVSDLGLKNRRNSKQKKEVVYLSEEELKAIEDLDLEIDSRLWKIRTKFLFQCYTGQRFGDMIYLKWTDIEDGEFGKVWVLFQEKMKSEIPVRIPIHEKGLKILTSLSLHENITGYVFETISNAKYNEYLKELAKLAGIGKMSKDLYYSGSVKNEKMVPKYELITSHVGRKTFISLSLERGMSLEQVKDITGHTDYKSIMAYIGQRSDKSKFEAINKNSTNPLNPNNHE